MDRQGAAWCGPAAKRPIAFATAMAGSYEPASTGWSGRATPRLDQRRSLRTPPFRRVRRDPTIDPEAEIATARQDRVPPEFPQVCRMSALGTAARYERCPCTFPINRA